MATKTKSNNLDKVINTIKCFDNKITGKDLVDFIIKNNLLNCEVYVDDNGLNVNALYLESAFDDSIIIS